jgi:uncharacterized membrane protein YkoI
MSASIQEAKRSQIILRTVGLAVVAIVSAYWIYAAVLATDDIDFNADAPVEASVTPTPLPDSLSGVKSLSEIQSLVLSANSGARIQSIKLEQTGSALAYGVRLTDGRIRYYDATTGAMITESKIESAGNSAQVIPDGFVATVSMEAARAVAADRVPLESVVRIELEFDKGLPVYCVHFSSGSTVLVSALDGLVVAVYGPAGSLVQTDEEQPQGNTKDMSTSTSGALPPSAQLETAAGAAPGQPADQSPDTQLPPEPEPIDAQRSEQPGQRDSRPITPLEITVPEEIIRPTPESSSSSLQN